MPFTQFYDQHRADYGERFVQDRPPFKGRVKKSQLTIEREAREARLDARDKKQQCRKCFMFGCEHVVIGRPVKVVR